MASGVPFSLHCTICYEPFNLEDRVPVVLPCGHTYLCEPCSKRLKSCMECRSPLFTSPPPKSPPPAAAYAPAYRHRSASSLSPPSRNPSKSPATSPVPERVPLPIPKNVVLITLLEAAQKTLASSRDEDKGYESGDDDEKVMAGMDMLYSDYGTYVVREKEGLTVRSSPPGTSCEDELKETETLCLSPVENNEGNDLSAEQNLQPTSNPEETTREIESVHPPSCGKDTGRNEIFRRKGGLILQSSMSTPSQKEETRESENARSSMDSERSSSGIEAGIEQHDDPGVVGLPLDLIIDESPTDEHPGNDGSHHKGVTAEAEVQPSELILSFGQTVQVVSFVDGVAKLARGRGYISATSKQLVKSKCCAMRFWSCPYGCDY